MSRHVTVLQCGCVSGCTFCWIDWSAVRVCCFFFFFSSRRRHTRCLSDWSSDVCSSDMRAAVTARWGEEVAPEGAVDRAAIAQRAFSSEEDRRWLEDTLWPLVGARVATWLADVRDQAAGTRPRAAIVEIPLLFEAGMEGVYDATIAVVSGEEVRRGR